MSLLRCFPADRAAAIDTIDQLAGKGWSMVSMAARGHAVPGNVATPHKSANCSYTADMVPTWSASIGVRTDEMCREIPLETRIKNATPSKRNISL